MKNYYEILGINRSASQDEIKSAFRKLSLKFHPDKNDGEKYFEEWTKKINEAFEILGNPTKRIEYDKTFFTENKNNENTNSNTAKSNSNEFYTLQKIKELTPNYLIAKSNLNKAQIHYNSISERTIPNKFTTARILTFVLLLLISAFGLKNYSGSIINTDKSETKNDRSSVNEVTIPSGADNIDEVYYVIKPKAYFFKSPENGKEISNHLIKGDKLRAIYKYENFVYTEYPSRWNKSKIIKGWIKLELLSTEYNQPIVENKDLETNKIQSNSESDIKWNEFWNDFKTALKENDIDKLNILTSHSTNFALECGDFPQEINSNNYWDYVIKNNPKLTDNEIDNIKIITKGSNNKYIGPCDYTFQFENGEWKFTGIAYDD